MEKYIIHINFVKNICIYIIPIENFNSSHFSSCKKCYQYTWIDIFFIISSFFICNSTKSLEYGKPHGKFD